MTAQIQKIKCACCGFLSIRNLSAKTLEEVDLDKRQTGNFPGRAGTPFGQGVLTYDLTPTCFVLAFNLKQECREGMPEEGMIPGEGKILQVIHKERVCPGFTPWEQGYSPKEHKDKLDENQRQKKEEEQRKADRRFEITLMILSGLFGIVGAAAGSIVTLLFSGN